MIFAIPVIVLLMSTALYYLVDEQRMELGTVNKGQLISPPLQFAELAMHALDGEQFHYDQPAPKWTFVAFGGLDCNDACEQILYVKRQTNTALGKKMNRVRRVYVTVDGALDPMFEELLAREYPHLIVLAIQKADVDKLFSNTGIDPYADNVFFRSMSAAG